MPFPTEKTSSSAASSSISDPAGIHSGDSIALLSPYQLSAGLQQIIVEQTKKIALALKVVGLFNVQFVIQNDEVMVIEANLRASRTVPLLSKTTQLPLVQIATNCILGFSIRSKGLEALRYLRS